MERIEKGVLRREEEFTDARVTLYFSCGGIRFQNYNIHTYNLFPRTLFPNQSWSYMVLRFLTKLTRKERVRLLKLLMAFSFRYTSLHKILCTDLVNVVYKYII